MMVADGSDDEHETPDANGSNDEVEDRAPLEAEVQGKLGEKLREAYSDVLDAPVPDRFLDLLSQLDAKSGHGKSRTDEGGTDEGSNGK